MTHSPDQSGAQSPQNLDQVLDQTKQVAEEIKDAADELKVVHAVLETGLAKPQAHPDIEKAVDRAQDLEQQLHESAEKLDSANEALERIQKGQA